MDYWKIRRRNKRLQRSRKTLYYRSKFDLSKILDSECLNVFRFTKFQIRKLVNLLKLPAVCRTRRIKFTGIEGLCIVLARLSYPNRFCDLVKRFNRDASALSRICNFMMLKIYNENGHRLQELKQSWMSTLTLESFAQACVNRGSWYSNIVGFIDGTARPVCRPSNFQKDMYSGYKKQHVVKYQSIVFPNGLIGRLDGPFIGRRHDAAILGLSNIRALFNSFFARPSAENYSVYGDPGYSNSKYIKVGFKCFRQLTDAQKLFNKEMSALPVSVEYGFGKILQHFAFLDFKKNQKLYLQNLKVQYYVAALLTNCHTCMCGSQVAEYFNLTPPTVEEYLT